MLDQHQLINSGALPSVKIGRRRLFASDAVNGYIDSLGAGSASG